MAWADDPGWAADQPTSEIWIDESAWHAPPALGLLDTFDILFRRAGHFQGTLAHELTHAAVWFHPDLLERWVDAQDATGQDLEMGDWRLGFWYNWNVYEEYEDDAAIYDNLVEGELFAMTIAAIMYDPWLNQGSR
ncbi:MAG: hypothetical protein AB1449_14310 [Chloroflexota bacterium]